jgi:phospho-N-acetylmuramoyl-pentapeptide-transferase
LLVLFLFTGLGVVGFLDDYIKISKQRSLGLRSKAKIAGQSIVAIVFAVASLQFPDERGVTPASPAISFLRDIEWLQLPLLLVIIWVMLLIAAASNGVNLTDGLDGLAAGSSIYAFLTMTVVAFWAFRHPEVYGINHALDLAVAAAAMVGGITGFLWWNAPPARIFMGDTGSLALGGTLAALALFTNTQLLLAVLGGLYVVETLSVILQVASFRLLERRVFKMAPIHLHFELSEWPEFTVIVRFWILAGLAVAFGLGLFYAEFLAAGGTGG